MKTSFTPFIARVLFSCTLLLSTATSLLHAGNGNTTPASPKEVLSPPGCVANYSVTTDSNCVTHFLNTSFSASSNVTYQWYDFSNGFNMFSTQASPSQTFTPGSHIIGLYMYVNGQFCDSVARTVNINCNGNPSGGCNASFTFSTDSTCMTNFVNTSTGTNLTYQWFINAHYSTQTNPSYALNAGSNHVALYVYSNGQLCDSLSTNINVANCGGNGGGCNASFTFSTDSTCMTNFVNTSTGTNLTYQWFINAHYSTQTNPSYALNAGSNHVALYVYSNGQLCDSLSTNINVANCGSNGGNCNANFTYSMTPGTCSGYFMSISTGSNLTYQWMTSNGQTSTSASTWLTLANGVNYVTLYVYSNGQFCDSTSRVVYTNCGNGGSCNANFWTYADSSNCSTHFVNTSSGAWSYQWFVGGQTSTQYNPVFNLSNGSYLAILLAYDSNGQICDSLSQMINVNCNNTPPCQAGFQLFADSANPGNYFAYNTSTGPAPISYLWNFGDGTTSTQAYPFHQYATPGNYVICLTITAGNCTSTYCDSTNQHKTAAMSSLTVMAGTTGIHESSIAGSIKTFPNPMTDELTLEILNNNATGLRYTMFDAVGRMVMNGNIEGTRTSLGTATLPQGFYFLKVYQNDRLTKTIKLVK